MKTKNGSYLPGYQHRNRLEMDPCLPIQSIFFDGAALPLRTAPLQLREADGGPARAKVRQRASGKQRSKSASGSAPKTPPLQEREARGRVRRSNLPLNQTLLIVTRKSNYSAGNGFPSNLVMAWRTTSASASSEKKPPGIKHRSTRTRWKALKVAASGATGLLQNAFRPS